MLPGRYRDVFALFFERKRALADEKLREASSLGVEEAVRKVDREYLGQLRGSIAVLPRDERQAFRKAVGSHFDLLNLFTLAKLRILYGRGEEEVLPYLLPYHDRFDLETLAELSAARSFEALSERAAPMLGGGFVDAVTFRRRMYRHHLSRLSEVWSGYPFSLAIPFALLRQLELEATDLKAIAEGLAAGLGHDEIVAMTVGA